MGGCMCQKVGSGQMTNLIKLELINIIWFSLKIYNLLRHPYLWVDGCVNGWAHVKPLKSNKSWPNRDNSIMDILDILLDILLKSPQPLMGLFFLIWPWPWPSDLFSTLDLDLDMGKMYQHTKNEVSMSRGSKVIAWTVRQTGLKTLPTHIRGW